MNPFFTIVYGCMIFLTMFYYVWHRKHLAKIQKMLIGVLYVVSLFCFLLLMNGATPVMPATYLEQWITPPVKMWLGEN
ncbi:hypothetical protein ACAF76_007905 [Brevibacillus sp. TJ4]|uniref:hypothetical protein n=1 Tax=Brevibacillus sp. TJ4 TaxID=3234853 RepID=UPI0037D61327